MMKPKRFFLLLAGLLVVLGVALGSEPYPARASRLAEKAENTYQLTWWTVDSGGGSLSSPSGTYTLNGTTGQPEAGLLSTTWYSLVGGFWNGPAAAANWWTLFLPLIWK
jgi:hypothetical protein